jgi:hypothetical protein
MESYGGVVLMFKDWKKAIWKAPLHVLLSAPVAAVSAVVPPIGKKYVKWRTRAEGDDESTGRDTPEKARIDLYTQTVLVRKVLEIYGIKL